MLVPAVTAGAKIRAAGRREDEERRMHLADVIRLLEEIQFALFPANILTKSCRLCHHPDECPISALLLQKLS